MKYYNDLDKSIHEQEMKIAGIDEADFIKKRKLLVKRMKDRRKSGMTKAAWRKSRFKYMKGINRFHKSNKGKRFHRDLGRFLATRDLKSLSYSECQELVVPITSCLTHAYHELEWYKSIEEDVDYEIFLEEVYDEVLSMLVKLKSYNANLKEDTEFLLRLCEANSLINAFADKFKKTKDEVERLWKKSGEIVKKQYKLDKTDDQYHILLVGILKKMLGAPSTRPRVVRNS